MTLQPDAQGGLWDVVVDDDEIAKLLQSHESFRDPARRYARAHRELKRRLEGFEHGKRYRFGAFVFTPTAISGGGFKVPKWTSWTFDVLRLD